MAIISFLAQKGGVGKSSLARLVAVEASRLKLQVAIADLDTRQSSCVAWLERRQESGPRRRQVKVVSAAGADEVLKLAGEFDLVVVDGAPHSSPVSLDVARLSDLIVIPTGLSLDDLDPAAVLVNNLIGAGIDRGRIVISLYAIADSKPELAAAREYLDRGGYTVLPGEIQFRTSYQKASDRGLTISEIPQYPTLRKRAFDMSSAIVDAIPS